MIQSTPRSAASSAVHVVRPHEGTLGSLRILAGIEQTRGLYFAFESETAPAPTLDLHAHAAYEESEYVLSGSREIVVEDEQWHAEPGLFLLAPRHAQHGMRTIGSASSRWLHFFSPAEIERYFVERERLREQGASADQLRALSRKYSVGDAAMSHSPEPVFVSSVDTRRDGIVATGAETRNAYALAERSALPEHIHVHTDQEEAFYVISGELAVELEGVSLLAQERSFVFVPRGLRRRHFAASGTRLLTIHSPGHVVPH